MDNLLGKILEQVPAHIYWKDLHGVYQGCNTRQAKRAGLSSCQEIVGKTDYDFLPAEQEKKIFENDQFVMLSADPYAFEEKILLNGEEYFFMSRKTPIQDSAGKVVGLLGTSLDITSQKKIDLLQLEKEKIQNTLDAAKGMAFGIAHELRTPFATIRNGVSYLQSSFQELVTLIPHPEKEEQNLKDVNDVFFAMEKEVKAGLLFIDMLLMNVKEGSNESERLENYSIKNILEETIRRYPFQNCQKKRVQINTENDFIFRGNEVLMTHIFFNLLKNGLYYIEKAHKPEPLINIWFEVKSTTNEIYVQDNGTGIPEDILPHVFDRFYTKTYHGTGLGLSFCKTVIEKWGGQIRCETQENEFTRFILSFPKIT